MKQQKRKGNKRVYDRLVSFFGYKSRYTKNLAGNLNFGFIHNTTTL